MRKGMLMPVSEEYPPEVQGIIRRIDPSWPELLEIGVGWYPLLARLDARLSAIAPRYIVQQVKSKFGALCFYARPSDDPYLLDDAFTEAINAAEWESVETCEACGAQARQYVIRVWVSTLCQMHARDARGDGDPDPPPASDVGPSRLEPDAAPAGLGGTLD